MISKLMCYILVIPFITWLLDSININNLFKKDKIVQARMLYIVLVLALSYLIVSFLFDVSLIQIQ